MKIQNSAKLLVVAASAIAGGMQMPSAIAASATNVSIDADDIGGRVTGAGGKPEAGVWVIAETRDLPTRFIKIAVTDDDGRYVVPDLTKAKYNLFVRGYGLVDSKPVVSEIGKIVDLTSVAAPSGKEAAKYYPANYWYALMGTLPAADFPGTGPKGNGIAPTQKTQQAFLTSQKGCIACHQWGNQAIRDMPPSGDSVEAWDQRITKFRDMNDPTFGNHSKAIAQGMSNGVSSMGRYRALKMFADWTDRIRDGEYPTEAPPRPTGKERNIVVSIWDWGNEQFTHDVMTADRRSTTSNPNGLVFGTDLWTSKLLTLDPKTGKTENIPIPQGYKPAASSPFGPGGPQLHNPMMDRKGRVWMTDLQHVDTGLTFCSDQSNKFAKLFPRENKFELHRYDPATKEVTQVPTCFSSHHIMFSYDDKDTLYLSGDPGVLGWFETKLYDETKDAAKANGWCPMVLDTNGDGKMTQDRNAWNAPAKTVMSGEGEQAGAFGAQVSAVKLDPTKDTRIEGGTYGQSVSPKDNSAWWIKSSPAFPGGVVRLERGANPPETCIVEYFEPPKLANGDYAVTGTRGIDIASNGIAWVTSGSGNISRFDHSKCKVTKGPTATGAHCPEAWTVFRAPGPTVKGTNTSADLTYLAWADHHDTFGLGKDVVMVPGSNSDSIIAVTSEKGDMMSLRVPYPMGFFARGVDGRIDDAKAGWKGRALWSNFATVPVAHQEDGVGDTSKVVKFQLRPDPLAH